MKRGLLVSSLLLATATAHATTFKAGATYNASHFESLEASFAEGQLPTQAELMGWWLGRCYTARDPDQAFDMLLTANDVYPDEEAPPSPYSHMPRKFVLNIWGRIAGHADALHPFADLHEPAVQQAFAATIVDYAIADLSLGEVKYGAWHSADTSVGFEFYLRRHGSEFVAKVGRNGTSYGNCYFSQLIK